jgi:hypothetical protein
MLGDLIQAVPGLEGQLRINERVPDRSGRLRKRLVLLNCGRQSFGHHRARKVDELVVA